MKPKQTLFVFDIDGTLTDTVSLHQYAFVQALAQLGVKEIDTNFNAYKHHTDYHIAKTIYEKDTGFSFETQQQAMFEDLLFDFIDKESFAAISGAQQMIAALEADSNTGVCYATGSLLRPAICKLQRTGINFAPLQLSASNGIEERESIVQAAIQQAKAFYKQDHFERIVSIGDGLWDLLTARNLGLAFIGIGNQHQQLLAAHGATLHFRDWQGFHMDWFSPSVATNIIKGYHLLQKEGV